MRLSSDAARALMLAAQGLHRRPRHAAAKADVLDTIRRMGALQIDTIHVVARSPYLVLWSRLGAYEPRWLDELLAEGALFEYWSHAACFLPIEDYGLYRRKMLDHAGENPHGWLARHAEEADRVLKRVREEGSVRAADFERTDGRTGIWWDWKAEKIALEALYTTGVLMIAHRQNFQRVYDLRERVLPEWDDAHTPSHQEIRRALVLKAVRALGVALARWVPDYFRTSRREIAMLLEELAREGAIVQVTVEGWDELPAYVHRDNREIAERAAVGALRPALTTLLSPFDPLIWDRARARALFDFDYRIETYTPSARRQYGYFSLAILHHGALVGRLDPKAHRKDGIFEVRALHLEPGVALTDELVDGLRQALHACAAWHQTPQVIVRRSDPPELATRLGAAGPEPVSNTRGAIL